jgi:hypothetical protein
MPKQSRIPSTKPQQDKQLPEVDRRTIITAMGLLFTNLLLVGGNLPRVLAASQVIEVDDGKGAFVPGGPSGLWWIERDSSYQNGSMRYTYNTDSPPNTPTNWATWTTPNLNAGDYDVWAYIPNRFATTSAARYEITYAGRVKAFYEVDQKAKQRKWVNLGKYTYDQGDQGQVYPMMLCLSRDIGRYILVLMQSSWFPKVPTGISHPTRSSRMIPNQGFMASRVMWAGVPILSQQARAIMSINTAICLCRGAA